MWYKTENGQLRTGECNLPKLQNVFKMNIRVKNVFFPIPILVKCGWGTGWNFSFRQSVWLLEIFYFNYFPFYSLIMSLEHCQ